MSKDMTPEERNPDFGTSVPLAVTGELTLENGGVYQLDQVSDAMSKSLTRDRADKVMLRAYFVRTTLI